jgi:transcriptional regulator with XRE-family HTH domain
MEAASTPMGERLRGLRRRRVLTQEQLAARSGVSAATIRRIETGQLRPRFTTIQKLAAALGISAPELAGTSA